MSGAALELDRKQILAFRREVGVLGSRLPRGKRSLERIAWAGLQDSMPRAATLSVNARMSGTPATVWDDPAFVQIWGPRYSAYVVAARDVGIFTLGRLPDDETARARAYDLAERLDAYLEGRALPFKVPGEAIANHPNALRYAAPTGTVLIRWDGARPPTVRTVAPPDLDPSDARKELARRYLRVFGPSTPEAFAEWAGVRTSSAASTFDGIKRSLTSVATPIGRAWMLNRDVETARSSQPDDTVRLLPSGDTYYLLQGDQRSLLVPRSDRRNLLWTSRVWPGAILANGDIVGTWRRAKNVLTASLWTRLTRRLRDEIMGEAARLPLPESDGVVQVDFVE